MNFNFITDALNNGTFWSTGQSMMSAILQQDYSTMSMNATTLATAQAAAASALNLCQQTVNATLSAYPEVACITASFNNCLTQLEQAMKGTIEDKKACKRAIEDTLKASETVIASLMAKALDRSNDTG